MQDYVHTINGAVKYSSSSLSACNSSCIWIGRQWYMELFCALWENDVKNLELQQPHYWRAMENTDIP